MSGPREPYEPAGRPTLAKSAVEPPGSEPDLSAPATEAGTSTLGRVLARAAAFTAVLTAAGALLGLVRDQTIANLFGAGRETDAFLIAWTVPEFASTLLIEDAMALVLVPAFSLALSRGAARSGGDADPVRELMRATLPRLALTLAALAGLAALAAPVLVTALAPGLADHELAVQCTRLTALSLFTFGVAGYFSAALRAHGCYLPPAAVYAAYNIGIIATVVTLHSLLGVRAAAVGVALGGALMALVQLPSFLRRLPVRRARRRMLPRPSGGAALVHVGLLAPVVLFALSRQAQVLVERFLGSSLPSGAISHLNYAQKVAQMPMVLSLMICTVTFPVVARAMADGREEDARVRVERDLTLAALVVLLGSAYVIAFAPQIIEVLFQRGAFGPADTSATAEVMRVYAVGLLGHSLVGALVRPFFSAARPTWYPAAAMGAGLLVTIVAGVLAAPHWGVHGIAAANAVGITVSALLLLRGLSTRMIAIDVPGTLSRLGRLLVAAAVAAGAGVACASLFPRPILTVLGGAALLTTVFLATALLVRAPDVPQLLSTTVRTLRRALRKVRHVR